MKNIYTVELVTGDGMDAVDWDADGYDNALGSIYDAAREHSDRVGERVRISKPVDGRGILYTITHNPISDEYDLYTEFSYRIYAAERAGVAK